MFYFAQDLLLKVKQKLLFNINKKLIMNAKIKKGLNRDEYSGIFLQTFKEYKTLKQNEPELNKTELKKLGFFMALMDDAKTVFNKTKLEIIDFFSWFHYIFVENNFDENIESWTFIETLKNIIQFQIEEIESVQNINNLNQEIL